MHLTQHRRATREVTRGLLFVDARFRTAWHYRRLSCEPLEPRRLLSGTPSNLDGHLLSLFQQARFEESNTLYAPAENAVADSQDVIMDSPLLTSGDRVAVGVWGDGPVSDLVNGLSAVGFRLENSSDEYRLLEGSLPVRSLVDAASLPGVLSITPLLRPVTHAGFSTSQGVETLEVDAVHALGYEGAGVKIGVLSDSVDQVDGGLGDSIATGDLPGAGNPDGRDADVQVLRDYTGSGSDEGRALLEIIHDVAPQAELAFHTAWYGQLDFAAGIRALADVGCQVIVDDVLYLNEPWFQDGIIAQAVNDVTETRGSTYVTAAGNETGSIHGGPYRDDAGWHDFDPSEATDSTLSFTVPAMQWGIVALQWSDPWYTADGVENDFDLYVYEQSDGSLKDSETTDNLATQQPMEWIQWLGSPHESTDYDIRIQRVAGSGDVELKLWAVSGTMNEYNDGPSILGHAAAEGAITVGAVPFYDPETVEPFSSTGPVTIYYDSAGNRLPTPEVRLRPDVVAPDNVNTTFFGEDILEDVDDFPNFVGTSAAAPHVAAVAALILEANSDLNPEEVRHVLSLAAVDLGSPGWDSEFGAGRVDALAAVQMAETMLDTTGPTASLVSPPSSTPRHVEFASLQFNEPLSPAGANDAASYGLRGAGADGEFDTPDDVAYTLDPSYEPTRQTVRLDIVGPDQALPIGRYRLIVDARITDESDNGLHGGSDQEFSFEVTQWSDPVAVVPFSYDADGVPDVAVHADGRSAVVWESEYETPSGFSPSAIVLAMYDENGGTIAGPLVVDNIIGAGNCPSVAMGSDGSVVVVYNDHIAQTDYQVYVSRFAPDGAFLGRSTVSDLWWMDRREDVAIFSNGDFVVTWEQETWGGDGIIYYRMFNADVTPKGDAVEIDPGLIRENPVVAVDAADNFVVAWERRLSSGSPADREVFAQRFDSTGAPAGDPVGVSTTAESGRGLMPAIGVQPTGEFIVAWGETDILARRFTPGGTPESDPFEVAPSGYRAELATLAMDQGGNFVIGWLRDNPDQQPDIAFARQYNASGQPLDEPFQVAVSTSSPALAMDGAGSFLAAWQGPTMQWYVQPITPFPDLQVSMLTVPEVATIGHHVDLRTTLYNHGVASAESFQLQYYISPDDEITGEGNDTPLLAVPVTMDAIWGGTMASDATAATLSADLTPGTYWIGVVADSGNTVAEDDETNNSATTRIELTTPPPAGPEFQANQTAIGDQTEPSVVSTPDGGYVVIWAGNGPEDDQGVFLQRFSAGRVPLGPEQRINQNTVNGQASPAVGSNAHGDFVVVWEGEDAEATHRDVFARRYFADGSPRGDEFPINTYTTGDQYNPAVTTADDGSFVAIWLSEGQTSENAIDVFGQRYDTNGNPLSGYHPDGTPAPGEFRVNTTTARRCDDPSVATLPDGSFVAAWTYKHTQVHSGVRYQTFGANGVAAGERIASEGDVPEDWYYNNPSLAASAVGETLLVWDSWISGERFRTGEIHGLWLSEDTEPLGEPFVVNSYRLAKQQDPHAAAIGDGGFVVTWSSADADGYGIYAQQFAADHRLTGSEWRINSHTEDKQDGAAVVGLGGNTFAVVWVSEAQDGSGQGVFARTFNMPAEVLDRQLFYNNSVFDTGDGKTDDDAIAIEKVALLPGMTPTPANYSSYSQGINGIMVDIAGLADPNSLDDNDFQFRVGHVDDPQSWQPTDPPSEVDVRLDAGVGGSDRVTLAWDEGAVTGGWLEVTVLVTDNTGLTEPDVFYFANMPGDADGNGTTDVRDFMVWNVNKFTDGTTPEQGDFNCDGVTDVRDFMIWNVNKFTSIPGPAPAPVEAVDEVFEAESALVRQLPDLRGLSEWLDAASTRDDDEKSDEALDKVLAFYW